MARAAWTLSVPFAIAWLPIEGAEEAKESLYLTGNWGGTREAFSNRGLDFTLLSKDDLFANLHGGLKKKAVLAGNLDLKIEVDFEKLTSISGLRAMAYGLFDYGGKPSKYVGDTQTVSNIQAPTTAKLYEAWVQQDLFSNHLSLLVGLRDLNQEFYATESSSLFLNGSFGMAKEFSQSGQNGPSVFPTTSLTGRLALQSPRAAWKFAILDGVPGDPTDPEGTHIKLKDSDGLLYVSEFNYLRGEDPSFNELKAKYAVGVWLYSAKFDALSGPDANGNARRNRNYGFYAFADQHFTEKFSAFIRFGRASDIVNSYDFNFSGGFHYLGLIPSRPNDRAGLAATLAHMGEGYRTSQEAAGQRPKSAETTLEFVYRAEIGRGISLSPDFQYVINPSARGDLDNASVLGLRTEINF